MNRPRISPVITYSTLYVLLIGVYVWLTIMYGDSFSSGFRVRDPFLLAGSFLATFGVMFAAIRSANEKWFIHASWLIFAVAYLIDNLATILQVIFKMSTFDNLPALLIMVSYTFISIGIAFLPSSPRPTKPRPRYFYDMIAFVGMTLVAAWVFLVIPCIFFHQPLYDQAFTALTFVMVFSVFDLLLRRRHSSSHRISTLFCISIAMTVIGELLIAVQRSETSLWVNMLMNICWIISYGSIGIAGISLEFISQQEGKESIKSLKEAGYQTNFMLPAAWAGFLFVLLIWSHFHPDILSFTVMAAGTGSLLIILLFRFNETLKENARLISDANKEIDSRKRMQEKFWHDSRHDALTSLPNRSYLVDQLEIALETTGETKNINSALLFLDLDRFKNINDKFGHDIGDQLLIAISERLIFCVRPDDLVARLGGDEFAIVLNNLQSSQTVYKIAARIMDKMKEPFEIQGNILVSGVSFGICFIQPVFTTPDEVLKEADKAMYRAKRKGRNRYETSTVLEF